MVGDRGCDGYSYFASLGVPSGGRRSVPIISDEFSYLLAADTFAHGRITNPPHPMAQFFDTFEVLQRPTYMSKYPPVQGLFLALGQLLGQPWIGVLISMALAYGAVLWMMQAWLPPKWALLGALMLMLQFDFFGNWADGYWGGFPALLGGALVMGGFRRLTRGPRAQIKNEIKDAVAMAVGVGILANTRPYEGSILCATVAVGLGIWLFGNRRGSLGWRPWGAIAAIAGIVSLVFAFMAYYNWRITGNAFLLPYIAYDQTHNPIPIFVWQKFRTIHFTNPQFGTTTVSFCPRTLPGECGRPLADNYSGGVGYRKAYVFPWENYGSGGRAGIFVVLSRPPGAVSVDSSLG